MATKLTRCEVCGYRRHCIAIWELCSQNEPDWYCWTCITVKAREGKIVKLPH